MSQGQRRYALLVGFLFSSVIGLVAYRRRSLTRDGVLGAMTTGTITFGMGGWSWGLSLIFFFLSSTFLSHFREREKEQTAIDKFSKGSQRDLGQAAANGGVATLLALTHGLVPTSLVQELCEAGYIGALATATADTWATEVGVLNPHQPRLITTGESVAPGTSGGITVLGTSTAALGALALGTFFRLLQRGRKSSLSFPLLGLVSGLAGSLFDSLLGATVQAMYFCPACHKETERHVHNCGTRTSPLRGLQWMNNDAVNFLATLFGACVAMILYRLRTRGKS